MYTPPGLPGLPDPATRYAYNADGQLTDVTRPDGGVVHLDYDVNTGQLLSVAPPLPRLPVSFTYLASGQVHTVASPDTVTCTYAWDGPLLKRESWSGAVTGTVERGYDNAFRFSTEKGYDHDAAGRLVSETVPGDAAASRVWVYERGRSRALDDDRLQRSYDRL